jgi:hypothetical protein
VDTIADEIRIYINKKLVAIGVKKPSELQPIHAVLWMYYADCTIEMGDFFPYSSLEPKPINIVYLR